MHSGAQVSEGETSGVAAERKRFHEQDAATLAQAVGITTPQENPATEKFAYFADAERFVVVAGAQERAGVQSALARGLGLRGTRRLVLVLPDRHYFATMQRIAWLKAAAQPEIWTYGKGPPAKQPLKTREQTLAAFTERLKPGQTLSSELATATTAKHLGHQSAAVRELVEWVTSHPLLDASHLKGERSWHCMGQKVLSITGTRSELKITGGIHYSGTGAPVPLVKTGAANLTKAEVGELQRDVIRGIDERLRGLPPIHRPDEHWLQAVIRRGPNIVGVEQPALREFPAWRPRDDAKRMWGRGYIDLLGVDGHGDIRIIETKLADNADELLIFQGLDYYVWARAYREQVRQRLAASKAARLEIHYVVGANTAGKTHVSAHAHAQAAALAEEVPWRFQTVCGWYQHPENADATSELLPMGALPGSSQAP